MLREAEGVGGSLRKALSVRALLFAAILIAGAPGVVFGALQAAHTYNSASRTDEVVRSDDAIRASVRFDATLRAAHERVAAFAVSGTIRNGGRACNDSLQTIIHTQDTYSLMGRTDASGRITCSSSPARIGQTVGDAEWFRRLSAGRAETASAATSSPTGAPSLVIAQAMRQGARFEGVGILVVPREFFARSLADDMGASPGAVAVFDQRGRLVAAAARSVPIEEAVRQASAALKASDGVAAGDGLSANVVETSVADYAFVSVSPQDRQVEITLRAALIVLAPVLVSAFSIVAIWFALDRWVLRWFFRLRDAASDFGSGRYAPPPMDGAPSEIASLAGAFESAVEQSRARETDLESALKSNIGLTRELHHRVKNNLQVLSSLISRQQRRTDEPVVRSALGEARARMAPVALAYRFINPPEDLVAIDMEAYLRELTRQLHVALNGDARGVKLSVTADSDPMLVDDATNLGLIVAEAFVCGYGHAAGMSGASAVLTSVRTPDGGHAVSMGVVGVTDQAASQHALDRELVQELARQLRAEAKFEPNGLIQLNLPPPRLPPTH